MRNLIFAGLAIYMGYSYYQGTLPWQKPATPVISNLNSGGAITISNASTSPPPSFAPSTPAFRCDGRQHCSQMGSYDEALYFLRNCPGTKMDGDGDGVPCERQFGR